MNYNVYINSNDKMSGKNNNATFQLIGMIFYQEIINIIMLLFLFKLQLVFIKMIQQIVNSILIVKLERKRKKEKKEKRNLSKKRN